MKFVQIAAIATMLGTTACLPVAMIDTGTSGGASGGTISGNADDASGNSADDTTPGTSDDTQTDNDPGSTDSDDTGGTDDTGGAGGGTTPVTPDPPAPPPAIAAAYVTTGNLPNTGFSVTYDSATDKFTIDDGTDQYTASRQTGYEKNGFRVYMYYTGIHANYLFAADGTSDAENALALNFRPTQYAGSITERLTPTNMPQSGTADFSGRYGAIVVDDTVYYAYNFLYGDVALSADFDQATISGAITNRATWYTTTPDYADVTLGETAIVNGAFFGTTTGGAGSGGNASIASDGTYSGMITGDNGNAVVGGVEFGHDMGGQPLTEHGIFYATDQ